MSPMSNVALAFVCALMAARAGQAPRDARVVAHGTSTISGSVVSDDADRRPVRHARVTLRGAEPFGGLTTITDDRGRFAFTELPPGRFDLAASKEGWVTAAYGARRPLRPGTSLPVAGGEIVNVTIRLPRGSAITGVVLDNTGQPSVGTTVRAMRYTTINGERRPSPSRASATTDDRGVYRIYGLPPGDYVVGASWRPGYFGTGGNELHLTSDLDVRHARAAGPPPPPPPDRTVALASTFYPGTTVPSQATILSIRPGEERSGVDFTVQIVPTARIDGRIVVAGAASALPGVQVSLVAAGQVLFPGIPFEGYRTTGTDTEGTFVFSDIAPGQYTLAARASLPNVAGDGASRIVWASTDLSVDGDAISGVSLMLAPGMTLSGRLRFDSASSRPPADMRAAKIALQPIQTGDAVTIAPAAATVDADGGFTIPGIAPGRYRLAATFPDAARSPRWIVRSAIVDGVDVLDLPMTIQPNQSVANALIAFTDRASQISGHLLNATGSGASGFTVVLFPEDQALWMPQSRRIQSTRPSVDGTFAFTSVAPGTYRLAVVDDVEPGEWFDPAFLRQAMSASMRVAIADGETRVQNVRVGATAR